MDYICIYCGAEFGASWVLRMHQSGCAREAKRVATITLDPEYEQFLLSIVEQSPEFQEHYA